MTNTSFSPSPSPETIETFQISRPPEIGWALKLLWLSLVISVGRHSLSLLTAQAANNAAILGLAAPFVAYIFRAYLTIKIACGRNSARITMLVYAALNLALKLFFPLALDGFKLIMVGISPALDFAALYLLFLTSGGRWFRYKTPHTER